MAASSSRLVQRPWRLATLSAVFLASLSAFARAEDPPAPPPAPAPAPAPGTGPGYPPPERATPGLNREQMWPAPGAEDWQKPVLLTWQRTWEDAVSVARETGKPILVCINMDGEIASEHYAGIRYRQPEMAALYEPYVLVVASVYRHSPRDYDDAGRRIPCPRFGGVTCGEHIAIEPGIFERFCDGQRIAPRHIMVEVGSDGGAPLEVYDVYYRNDTASVFESIRRGIAERPTAPKPPVVRGDRPLVERVASRDVADRSAVEKGYQEGTPAQRAALLEAAAKHAEAAPLDLLRLGVFGLDPELSKQARAALAMTDTADATTLVSDALRVPMDAAEKEALIATLKRLGSENVLARWLAVVHQGLSKPSGTVDAGAWQGGGTFTAPKLDGASLPEHLESRAQALKLNPSDPLPRLDLAEASLIYALEQRTQLGSDSRTGRLLTRALFEDARRFADQAEALGAKGWRVDAVRSLAAYYAGDAETGYALAATAMKSLQPGDTSWASMAVLKVFAEWRWKAIKQAVKDKLDFPPEWLADVNGAYAVLQKHPLGTADDVLWHYDLLDWLGATDQASGILEAGVQRFAASAALHARLRAHLLRRRDVDGLEAVYAGLVKPPEAPGALVGFAALASVTAGDTYRRIGRLEAALSAYERAAALYERSAAADAAQKPQADHGVALVLAARARVAYQLGRDADALAAILGSFARSPASAGSRDDMGITPGETAQMLLARLKATKQDEAAARLDAALATLDPELLKPDRP